MVENMPHDIRLGKRTVPIEKVKGLIRKKGIMGRSISYSENEHQWKVLLDKDMKLRDMADTLLHETMHSISENDKLGLKEGQVEKTATDLLAHFRNNPPDWKVIKAGVNGTGKGAGDTLDNAIMKVSSLSKSQAKGLSDALLYVFRHNPRWWFVITRFCQGGK